MRTVTEKRSGLGWLGVALLASAAAAQTWKVEPASVRAHESFLASDVLAGRGSATRDEQIAATYVAAEFEGYGLQHAPGMSSYLQTAAVRAPQLDGHATLSVGGLKLQEGKDFTLVVASGADQRGVLEHLPADLANARPGSGKGQFLLLGAVPPGKVATAGLSAVRRLAPSIVAVVEDDSIRSLETAMGGTTRVPVSLAEQPERSGGAIVAVSAATMDKLMALPKDAEADLAVHALARKTPPETFNAVGYLPGSYPGAGTLLLTAHLDHLGTRSGGSGDRIFNGANDDAAGTTAVLELAHALAAGPKLRRSVLFVCYGSEEAGELGSTYFGAHPPVPLTDLVANLEFEMIGNQDPKMPPGVLLLTGWERSNLGPELKKHGALVGPDPYPEEHFFERSDNYALALRGVVAHTAAGWGTPPTYHQPSDDLEHLDFHFMTAAIQSLVEPVRWLASSDFKPQWNPGGKPGRE